MGYFPTRMTKYFGWDGYARAVESVGDALLSKIGREIREDTLAIITAEGPLPDFHRADIAVMSPRVEDIIKDGSFRFLVWRIGLEGGTLRWKLKLSNGLCPSITFEYDLLGSEGCAPSEEEVGESCRRLIDDGVAHVMEAPFGYYGFAPHILLRYLHERDERPSEFSDPRRVPKNSALEAYIGKFIQVGVDVRVPVRLESSKIKPWVKGMAEKLGVKPQDLGSWLTHIFLAPQAP